MAISLFTLSLIPASLFILLSYDTAEQYPTKIFVVQVHFCDQAHGFKLTEPGSDGNGPLKN